VNEGIGKKRKEIGALPLLTWFVGRKLNDENG